MKKIFQLIVSIPHDKLLHIIAGMIVVMLVLRLVSFIGIPGMIARIIALIAVILTGVLREVYNKKHGGVFDKKRFVRHNFRRTDCFIINRLLIRYGKKKFYYV